MLDYQILLDKDESEFNSLENSPNGITTYNYNEQEYSILQNLQSYSIVWRHQNRLCMMVGIPSKEDAIKIIESLEY